ncbi:MAG: WYL domain-containing protein [Acidimicrobiia bacterium]
MTSPRTAERLTRILAMLPWVIAHPGATVDEVCERFGYSRSELVKDLNLVLVCGVPGYGPGELMDAFIDGDEVVVDAAEYFARPVRLTAAEALMLLAAGMAIISAESATPALTTAVAKLQAVIDADDDAVSVDIGAEPEAAVALRRAATTGNVVTITYTALGSGETTVRDVEPWAVFGTLGNWYVNGYCRRAAAERVFRIDRIREVVVGEERFDPPAVSSEAEVRYSPSVDDVTARIELSPPAAWVADYYPVSVVSDTEAGRVVDFSATDPMVTARLLLRLGNAARLVSGSEVESATRTLRERILARYE